MIIKLKNIQFGDEKSITKFLWFPLYYNHSIIWLETVKIVYRAVYGCEFLDFTFRRYNWKISNVYVLR